MTPTSRSSDGGIGSFLTEELARIGVHRFTLIDPDRVERSNLPPLIGAVPGDVGRTKVSVAGEQVSRANPTARTNQVCAPVEECADALRNVDLIVASVDQVSTRLWLNHFAVDRHIPYVDASLEIFVEEDTVTGMIGAVQCIVPPVTACFDCRNRGDMDRAKVEEMSEDELEASLERGYIEGTELAPRPAVIHLNGQVASMAVGLISKLLTGYEPPAAMLYYDGLEDTISKNSLGDPGAVPSDHCVTCTYEHVLGLADPKVDTGAVEVVEMEGAVLPEASWYPPAVTHFFDEELRIHENG